MIYTITLNPSLDYYMDYSNEKISKWARTNNAMLFAAGKGINASSLLNSLGAKSIALTLSGGDTGRMLLDKMKKQKIKSHNFDTFSDIRINVKAQFDNTYEFIANSKNLNPNIESQIYNYLNKNLKSNDILMIMGSRMDGLSKNILNNISKIANEKKTKLVFDLSNDELVNLLKFKPFVIKPNVEELGNLFKVNIKTYEDIKYYANKLIELGAKNVIISHDKNGAYLFNEKLSIFTKPLKIKLINSSGAGDSMLSGFIYQYLKTKSFEKAINYANASGSGTASVITIADAKTINELYEKVVHEYK